jgi:hypothetical protein
LTADPSFKARLSLVNQKKIVTPAKAGVQFSCTTLKYLDTGFRRYDVLGELRTFYDVATLGESEKIVTPAKAGVQFSLISGFRRDDVWIPVPVLDSDPGFARPSDAKQ